MVTFDTCPVDEHNYNRKAVILFHISGNHQIKVSNEILSILQWQTVSYKIPNAINDRPLALGNIATNYENMDLSAPTRLKL